MDKKAIIKISSLLAIVLTILLILSLIKTNNNKKIERLNDSELFFELQNTINDELINNEEYTNPTYIAKDIYIKKNDLTAYYLINGYIIDYIIDQIDYIKNVNYLLILKGNTYNIKKLDTNDIKNYEIDFETQKLDTKNGKFLKRIEYSETNKLTAYISNYLILLNVDKNEAIKLSNNKVYNINSSIDSYSKNEYDDRIEYTITDIEKNKIILTEYSVNNYVIDVK